MSTHEDDKFFGGIGEQLEGRYPGMHERIESLVAERIGKPIEIRKFDSETHDWLEPKLVGILLPTNTDNTEHVGLFDSGDVVVFQLSEHGEIEAYRRRHEASDVPYQIMESRKCPLAGTIYDYTTKDNPSFHRKVTLRNTNPQDRKTIVEKVSTAIDIARAAKAEREDAMKQSLDEIFFKIDDFLKPNTPKFDLPPDITGQPPQS